MDPLTLLSAANFARKFWLPIAGVLLALALWGGISLHLRNDRKVERALQVSEVARKTLSALYKAEIDRLTRDLASAKEAGERAKAETVAADKAAAKRLAQARKDWEKLYGSKPETRVWADAPLPADVERRLRERPGTP